MKMSSAMMNPFEFRESMWSILYEGEAPTPRPKTDPPPRRGRKALPKPGPARRMSKRDAAALDAFNAEILEIARKRESASQNTPES